MDFGDGALTTVATVSGVLGLLSLMAYYLFQMQAQSSKQSLDSLLRGEPPSNSKIVVQILAQFKDDDKRLEALKSLLGYDAEKAEGFLAKIKGQSHQCQSSQQQHAKALFEDNTRHRRLLHHHRLLGYRLRLCRRQSRSSKNSDDTNYRSWHYPTAACAGTNALTRTQPRSRLCKPKECCRGLRIGKHGRMGQN